MEDVADLGGAYAVVVDHVGNCSNSSDDVNNVVDSDGAVAVDTHDGNFADAKTNPVEAGAVEEAERHSRSFEKGFFHDIAS